MHRTLSQIIDTGRQRQGERERPRGGRDNISARTISQSVSLKMTAQQRQRRGRIGRTTTTKKKRRRRRRRRRMRPLLIVVEREKHDEIRGGWMQAQLLGRTRHNAFRGFLGNLSMPCGALGENASWSARIPTTRPAKGDANSEENNVRMESKPVCSDCARGRNKLYESSNMGARARGGKAIHQEMNCGQRRPTDCGHRPRSRSCYGRLASSSQCKLG